MSLSFIIGAFFFAALFAAFSLAHAKAAEQFDPENATLLEILVAVVSPVFASLHELGHVIGAVLMGCSVESVKPHVHYSVYSDGEVSVPALGNPHTAHEFPDALRNAFIAAAPLLLWVPAALFLAKNPLFASDFANGVVFSLFLLSGMSVLTSAADRANIAAAFKPLALIAAAIVLGLASLTTLMMAKQADTQALVEMATTAVFQR